MAPVRAGRWARPTGTTHGTRSLGLLRGEWLLLLHAGRTRRPCTLPPGRPVRARCVDSTRADGTPADRPAAARRHHDHLPPRSLLLLRRDVPPAG